jgi:hypothetical protein
MRNLNTLVGHQARQLALRTWRPWEETSRRSAALRAVRGECHAGVTGYLCLLSIPIRETNRSSSSAQPESGSTQRICWRSEMYRSTFTSDVNRFHPEPAR